MKQLNHNKTILIVEDDDNFRLFLEYFFKQFGHDVILTECPEQALKILQEEELSIDLAYFDINYGYKSQLNGFDLAEQIQDNLSIQIPFFIMSMDDSLENQIRAEQVGALGFLEKIDQAYEQSLVLAERYFEDDAFEMSWGNWQKDMGIYCKRVFNQNTLSYAQTVH